MLGFAFYKTRIPMESTDISVVTILNVCMSRAPAVLATRTLNGSQ